MSWLVRTFDTDIKSSVGGILGMFKKESEIYQQIKTPKLLTSIRPNFIREVIREDISTYKFLGYAKNGEEEMRTNEWHSWQVSFMVKAIVDKIGVVIHNKEEVFPAYILSLDLEQAKQMAELLLSKYNEQVDSFLKKEQLQKDIRWSPLEVGHLLHYISLLAK